jgi:diguanylate cyclase (GGDEF)-like protein
MQKIAILYDASQAVMSTFELDEVLARILKILRDYFQMQNAAVMLLDRETGDLIVRSHFGRAPRSNSRIPQGAGLCGAAIRMRRPVYVPDVSKDPRYLMGFATTRSELTIPLMVRDEVLGVLDMQSETLDYFDHETIDLLTLFATQASIALENARLYTREQRRAQQLEAINAIARQTTALVDLDHLLDKICVEVLERFPVDQVTILLLEKEHLHVRANLGKLTPVVALGERIPNTGLASRAINSLQTILENRATRVEGFIPVAREGKSEMCVPLVFFGEKLGVLILTSGQEDAFDPNDIQPLESVADICAAAIANARHFEQTEALAYLDGLTGIHNRRYFEKRIAEELERSQRYQASFAVVMLDIDHFKRLNDEFGHLLGDEVLRQVSNIFAQQLRKGDLLCRYGGEEFALLLPNTSGGNALEVAEKLRRTTEAWHFPGVPRAVTVSAGIADYPEFGTTRDELVSSADAALYHAKQLGRNRVCAAAQIKKTTA